MPTNLFDHTFQPWRDHDGARIVASEPGWRRPLAWDHAAFLNGARADFWVKDRPRVFINRDVFEDWTGPLLDSSGDVLCAKLPRGVGSHDTDPLTMQDVRDRLFRLIDSTPNLDWIVSTRFHENVAKMMPAYFPGGYIAEAGRMNQEGPRPNLWIEAAPEDRR